MTIYVTEDGHRLQANRCRDLIEMLRAESWIGRGGNIEMWMREVSERVKTTTGKRVRANTETNFVNDLVKAGLLKKETGNV